MGNTTQDKLKEMMEQYQKRIGHIDTVINTLDDKLNKLQDKKDLLVNDTINPLITSMNNILSSLSYDGTLYKNKYYGVEDLQGWAWYNDLGFSSSDLTYIDDDTFYVNKDVSTLKAGQYILVKDSKYGYMERYIKNVIRTGTMTKVYLDKSKGPLSNPISLQGPYLSHENLYPSCVKGGGKMPSRTDCCTYDDKVFKECKDALPLEWKKIETSGLSVGNGSQLIEVKGGLPPYDWWVENTTDFSLAWNQTEGSRNTLTYNYKGTGSKISVTDYCKTTINEDIMPQEYEYVPGVFKIIINSDVSYAGEKQPVTIKISKTTGRHNDDLSFVFDEIGENWQKIYIKDSDGNVLYSSMHFWKSDEKIGLITFDANIKLNQENIFYCYFGAGLPDNEWIVEDVHYNLHDNQPTIFTNMYGKNGISMIDKNVNIYTYNDGVNRYYWNRSESQQMISYDYMSDSRIDKNDPNSISQDYFFDYGYDLEYKSAIKLNYDDPISYSVSLMNWTYICDPGTSYPWGEPYRDYLKGHSMCCFPSSFDDRYLDNPPGVPSFSSESSTFTAEFFIYLDNIKESVDCWDINSGYKDKYLYTSYQGQGSNLVFKAETGALRYYYVWKDTHNYWHSAYLLESNTKNWDGWYHIALSHTWKENILRMYVNGELEDEANICEKMPTFCDSSSFEYPFRWTTGFSSVATVDNSVESAYKKFLKTKIDETRLSHVQHSQERIKMHMLDMKDELCYYEKIAVPKRV